MVIYVDNTWWQNNGKGADRLKATKMREKVQVLWTLWGHSGTYKSSSAEWEDQLFNSVNYCFSNGRRRVQLQAHELEVQMWEPYFQPLILIVPQFTC